MRRNRGGRPENPWDYKMKRSKGHLLPPNLTGRQIGEYFRNRTKEKQQFQQAKKEMMITFGIPQSVENRVRANLQEIVKHAKRFNISISAIENPFPETDSPQKDLAESTCSIDDKSEQIKVTPSEIGKCKVKSEPDEENTYIATLRNEDESHIFDKVSEIGECKVNRPTLKSVDDSHVFKKPITPLSQPSTSFTPKFDSIKSEDLNNDKTYEPIKMVSPSSTPDFIPIRQEDPDSFQPDEIIMSLRGGGDYKYGYEDIITGTFEEKLEECLAKGIDINLSTPDILSTSRQLYFEYQDMHIKAGFQRMMAFRKKLPTYNKSAELLDVIENNQVIVISGETGCGKSTQVPQLILDSAICKGEGANTNIIVTQPRRIAASSLAQRVSQERAEQMGNSVGYAVRLEKVDARPRGSITFVTTGVLLAELETNQGLTSYSHVILDEVHERDCHVDLTMCMLKKVLQKRKDLKLILMSATLDAEQLSTYFDRCPVMHIEGLAYPVEDVYLEDILLWTGYQLPPLEMGQNNHMGRPIKPWMKHTRRFKEKAANQMEKTTQFHYEVGPWVDSLIKKRKEMSQIRHTLLDQRIEDGVNIDIILQLLHKISREPPGAVLVFLPGIGDITKLIKNMENSNMFPPSLFEVYPLHSKLPSLDQHKIFERPPHPKRKIIIATNIAETSITIDDIVYVIDCAKLKISGLNVEENVSTLKTEWVSQANLRQRRGRAGRCQPGVCYHLLTSMRAEQLAERLTPELQRSDLLEPVLTIKRLRLGIAAEAMKIMPSPPAVSTVEWAVKHLQQCGALNESETLTPLGWHLARLPIHPAAGKLVLLGALFGCLDRAASVAAVWGFKDPFQLVIGKEKEVDETKRNFALGEPSDHIAISEAIIQWEHTNPSQRRSFAHYNFLSHNTLELLSDMKQQLGDSLQRMGFLPLGNVKATWENRNANNLSLFKAIIAAALYPKIATVRWLKMRNRKKQPRIKVILPADTKTAVIHPSSIMTTNNKPGTDHVRLCENPGANWLVYWLKQRSSDLYLIDVTLVYTLPLLFFGELSVKILEGEEEEDMCTMSIAEVNVRCKKSTATSLFELRALLDQVLAYRVMGFDERGKEHFDFHQLVLNALIELITAEDERTEYIGGDDSESDNSDCFIID